MSPFFLSDLIPRLYLYDIMSWWNETNTSKVIRIDFLKHVCLDYENARQILWWRND